MRRPAPKLLPWLAGILAIYLTAPFVAGLAHLGSADWRSADWNSLGSACAVSLASATVATVLVTAGGVPLGYLLARVPGRRMALLGFMVQLPLALPPLASGILLLFLLGYASPIGRLTQGALTDSFLGIILAETFVAAPFLIIAARSAFAALDPMLEDVAATLGHPPWGIFLRISLPLAWRAILAGMLLAWLRAFGEFGATVMVAYHPYSLPVYTYVAFGSQGLPAMLPVLLPTLAAALAVMALAASFNQRELPRPLPMADTARISPIDAASAVALSSRPARSDRPIRFAFRRALPGFEMNVTWSTRARRLAILGASGSGKSLTLRTIAGLDQADGDTLILDGRDLSGQPPARRGVAYVPQNYGLFPHLTLHQQLRFAIGHDPELARYWTERLGLSGLEQRRPAALSLGQQQRVALGRALSRPASLLLLDEPFSALDTALRVRLRRELRALQEEIDATTILVSHDPQEAFLLADELLIVHAGRVLQAGPVDDVFARPADETVARLLGADNMASGQVTNSGRIDVGNGIEVAVAGPRLRPGAQVCWSVNPGRIRIVADGPYHGTILGISRAVAGQGEAELQLGGALLRVVVDPGKDIRIGPCRMSIDPLAVQTWTTREQ